MPSATRGVICVSGTCEDDPIPAMVGNPGTGTPTCCSSNTPSQITAIPSNTPPTSPLNRCESGRGSRFPGLFLVCFSDMLSFFMDCLTYFRREASIDHSGKDGNL